MGRGTASGDLRVKNGVTQIRYTAPGEKRGKWYDLDEKVDLAHKTDAVTWWNTVARPKGYKPRGQEVRAWMLDSKNYTLQPRSVNRSMGAQIGETYEPPFM